MKKLIGILSLAFAFFSVSCNKDEGRELKNKESSFERIYEFSEMALLMEEMYSDLEKIRPNILENKDIGTLPPKIFEIHTAEMTNTFERTFEFKRLSELLINTQKQLYESKSDSNRIDLYNNVVNSCLVCHKSPAGCDGPIPRISGLLIKKE